MYSDEFYRVALHYIEGYGQANIKQMLQFAGSAREVFECPDRWQKKLNRRNRKVSIPKITEDVRQRVDAELRMMQRDNIRDCLYTDADYPYRLKQCDDSPMAFFYKGAPCFNDAHMLSIVGTRDASDYGRNSVRKLLSELREYGVTTVSGLAYGVDTAAHARSIENEMKTIAVLGNGLGMVYPQSNARLAVQIIEHGGTLISEYLYRVGPERQNFPRRNRIVAGLSDATLVIETANKGGSMITANIAHSYNRDVFAVPGSIFDAGHEGCHELIRSNMAAVVYSGDHIVEYMNWRAKSSAQSVQMSLFVDMTEQERAIVDAIRKSNGMTLDVLSENFPEYTPSKLAGVLLTLELKGVLMCKPGKNYVLGTM